MWACDKVQDLAGLQHWSLELLEFLQCHSPTDQMSDMTKLCFSMTQGNVLAVETKDRSMLHAVTLMWNPVSVNTLAAIHLFKTTKYWSAAYPKAKRYWGHSLKESHHGHLLIWAVAGSSLGEKRMLYTSKSMQRRNVRYLVRMQKAKLPRSSVTSTGWDGAEILGVCLFVPALKLWRDIFSWFWQWSPSQRRTCRNPPVKSLAVPNVESKCLSP